MNAAVALRAVEAPDSALQPALRECVARAVRRYLHDMDGEMPDGLYDLVLQEVAEDLDRLARFGGRVVYCDADTYFLSHPRRLFNRIGPGRTVMHIKEGNLHACHGGDIAEFLQRHQVTNLAGERWPITAETPMYNAGVIGLDAADAPLLDEVVHLTDQMYPPVRIHTVEQFAFSDVSRHPEGALATEGSAPGHKQILRFAQNDRLSFDRKSKAARRLTGDEQSQLTGKHFDVDWQCATEVAIYLIRNACRGGWF